MAENDKTIESVKAGLHELIRRLRAERDVLDTKIKQHETDLINLGDTTVGKKGKRRGWGENKRLVEECLKANSTVFLSVAEIAKRVGIARSSVRSALFKLKENKQVEESVDGTWKYK